MILLLVSATFGQRSDLTGTSGSTIASSSLSVKSSHSGVLANEVGVKVPELRIGAGDLIDISIFDTPELSQKARVTDSGDVALTVGGSVHVGGLTAAEAGAAIEKCLRDRDVLRDPHVSVFELEYATQGVTVLGEVKSPGVYPLIGPHNVLDFISVAGGLTQFASKTVVLTHKDSPGQALSIDLGNAENRAAGDVALRPGDRIVVNRAGTVYVLGDVGRPGGYLIENKSSMTVLQGLALAQGLNRTAKLTSSLIRNTPSGPVQEPLDLKKILASQVSDPALHDGDIVFVPVNSAKDWAIKGINSIMQMAVGVVIYGRY